MVILIGRIGCSRAQENGVSGGCWDLGCSGFVGLAGFLNRIYGDCDSEFRVHGRFQSFRILQHFLCTLFGVLGLITNSRKQPPAILKQV